MMAYNIKIPLAVFPLVNVLLLLGMSFDLEPLYDSLFVWWVVSVVITAQAWTTSIKTVDFMEYEQRQFERKLGEELGERGLSEFKQELRERWGR